MLDPQNSLVGGGALVGCLLYAGTSMYVTGPLIAERMAHKSGWATQCVRNVQNEIQSRQSQPEVTPQIDCGSLLRGLTPDMRRMIDMFGGGVACDMLDAKQRQQEALAKLQASRLQSVASRAGHRCECAVSTMIESKRVAVGLYAGSARLITPSAIRNLEGELTSALHASSCAAITNDGGGS